MTSTVTPRGEHPQALAAEGVEIGSRLRLWEERLQKVALVLARLGLAYLFFTQLWWKVPPSFGCPPGYPFTTGSPARLQRTSGLCDWIGVERVWSDQPHPILVADMTTIGGPRLSINIGLLSQINGWLIAHIFQPEIGIFGWLIFFAEAFIFISLFLGLFSRLGGLVAIGQSTQLLVGLAGISNPNEWEWPYILMVLMAFLVFAFAPGRIFGLDAWLRPRLQDAAGRSGLARLLFWLT
jgi:hypothetical protein